jgi:hypothetical protein
MNYEEIEIDGIAGKQKHIILDLGEGAFKSFPANLENPEYKAWAISEGIIEPVEAENVGTETEPMAEPVIEPAVEPEVTEAVIEPEIPAVSENTETDPTTEL